jgi:glycosyltransferase involved in cell wall biosynthesis
MRILFSTYPLAFQNAGGGERVYDALSHYLGTMGHTVVHYSPWKMSDEEFTQFDVIHYFSCVDFRILNFFKDSAPHLPLVLTPTYYPTRTLAYQIAQARTRRVQRWDQGAFPGDRPDVWLPATDQEGKDLIKYMGVASDRTRVLPNGIEESFTKADPALFLKFASVQAPFVLHVGRFHPVKNQLGLIEALKQTGSSGIFLGKAQTGHEDYYRQCAKAAKSVSNIFFLPEIPHGDPLLPSAFAAAKVFALPSHFETFGIAALEAAVAGHELVLSENIASREIFSGYSSVQFVKPNDPLSIAKALDQAMHKETSSPLVLLRRDQRAHAIYEKYNWPTICQELIKIYSSLGAKA